jgi:actin-like ATPase involved in cell morphogenesis
VSGYVLGIDVGTTYTGAAIARDGRVEVVSIGHHSSVVPSVVFLREDGELLIGEAANRRALQQPDRVAREFKRRMGDPTPLMLAGTPFSPEALTARLLRSVYDQVVALQGSEPDHLVLSHPANWGPYKTDLLAHAVRLAGLDAAMTVSEPEAAAWYYASRERLESGQVMAVYDLGGGTFDVAVMRRTDKGFEILGTPEGIDRLGGIDIDEAVLAHVRAVLVEEAIARLTDGSDDAMVAAARLRRECVEAKEALSADDEVIIPIVLPDFQDGVRITREELERSIRPMLLDTIDALRRALESAEVRPDDLSVILVVGGSSRLPCIAEMITEQLGRPVAVDAHPKHACALGAALVGDAVWAQEHDRSTRSVVVIPPRPTNGDVDKPPTGAETAAFGAPLGPSSGTGAVPPPPVDSDPEPAPDRKRRRLAIAAVLALLALVAGAVVATSGGGEEAAQGIADTAVSSPTTAGENAIVPAETSPPVSPPATEAGANDNIIVTAGEIILEPLGEESDDAFTESVAGELSTELLAFASSGGAIDTIIDDGAEVAADEPTSTDAPAGPTTLLSFQGTDPGVFGGTRDEATCDPELLVTALGRRPTEAAAWAEVLEIEVENIEDYVATMTAVNLTVDTRVTNHGFLEGEAIPRQSVLQVGTAVLVDEFGVPRVRCSSGSPLLPPEAVEGTTAYLGPAWATFDPATTAAVAPAPEPAAEFELLDVAGGDGFIRPVGSSGGDDRALLPGEILAVGELTFSDLGGATSETNEVEMVFSPTGGPVAATFAYALSVQGITIDGSGELTGTFDPATNTMTGSGFGTVTAGGFGGSNDGTWSATVDPEGGVVNAIARTGADAARFDLFFDPYTPST